METEVKNNVMQTSREKLLHNKPLDHKPHKPLDRQIYVGKSDGAILKKQNSDDSGYREPIDDNNSITKPTAHQPRPLANYSLTGTLITRLHI